VIASPLAQSGTLAGLSQGEKNFAPGLAADAYENLCRVLKGDPDWKSACPASRNSQAMDRSRERPSRPDGLLGVEVSTIFDGLEEGYRSGSEV